MLVQDDRLARILNPPSKLEQALAKLREMFNPAPQPPPPDITPQAPDPTGLGALRGATGIERVPTTGEKMFGIGRKASLTDMMGDFIAGGAFSGKLPDEPDPVDGLLMLAGAGGLAKGGRRLWQAATAETKLAPLMQDKFALSEAPMDRRNFFYRASGAPKKLAEARVNASPALLENASLQLSKIDAANPEVWVQKTLDEKLPQDMFHRMRRVLKPNRKASMERSKVADKIAEEATLVDKLQTKYGMLNENPAVKAETVYGKPKKDYSYNNPDEPHRYADTVGSKSAYDAEQIKRKLSTSIRKRVEGKLEILGRTKPVVKRERISEYDADPVTYEKYEANADKIAESQERTSKVYKKAKAQLEAKYGKEPDKRYEWDDGPNGEKNVRMRKTPEYKEYLKNVQHNPRLMKISKAGQDKFVQLANEGKPLREKIDESLAAAYKKQKPEVIKTDPVKYMEDAVSQFHARMKEIDAGPPKRFRNQSINQTGAGKTPVSRAEALATGKKQTNRRRTKEEVAIAWGKQKAIAEETLRKQAAQFGGLQGMAMKELAESIIAGRPAVVDAADNMVASMKNQALDALEKRTGVRVRPAIDIAEKVDKVAETMPTPARITNNIVNDLKKRFGIKDLEKQAKDLQKLMKTRKP